MSNPTNPGNNPSEKKGTSFGPPFTRIPKHAPEDGAYTVETDHHATASVLQKTANVADFAAETVEDAASYAGSKAHEAANYVGLKTGNASAAAGNGLRSLGDSVRESGPATGMGGEASAAVADTLDKSGRYLQEEGIKDMAEDLTNLIRRNPIPAMLVGIAAGYLAGRAVSPRS